MCGSILLEVERAAKRKCVAVYLGRLREQQKESVWQIVMAVERAPKRMCGSILREVERAAKRKCMAVYLGRLREQQQQSVWQHTLGG